ncbi:MAG: peroxide stress protein YaaA, partial [Bacillota bacterium]|nr:peroxide stress protein YaaA [Bacillota bacterium]
NDNKDLYEFWSEKITKKLEADLIINLASNEYSKVINLNKINIIFGELINDKVVEKGTLCKMARGKMVRYMAENNIKDVDSIKNFDRLGYKYNKEFSDEYNIVFIKD